MNSTKQHNLTLQLKVSNSDQLESGCAASHLFEPQGGSVGSGETCQWRLQDCKQKIATHHLDITFIDGAFCLIPLQTDVRINGATSEKSIGLVRLQHGDEIALGLLTLKTFIRTEKIPTSEPVAPSLESQVASYSPPPEITSGTSSTHFASAYESALTNEAFTDRSSQDPLQVLKNEILSQAHTGSTHLTNDWQTSSDVISPPSFAEQSHDLEIDQDMMTLPRTDQNRAYEQEELTDHYLALAPLMRGLDVPLALRNSQQVNDFLEEVGRTLQSAIRGLLALQSQQDALSDRHLRPLEDNPLRLNLDYNTAMDVLFAEGKSPVHLSAPEAVAECLYNLGLHQQANQTAINEALAVILAAFSPQRLKTRFARYRRNAEREEMDAAWAWEMYCRYYAELTSSRQQGFRKLFNEVYEQVYDRTLRQEEPESQS